MSILVKMSATLRKKAPDHDPATGLVIEADGLATVSDILARIGLNPNDAQIVIVNGVAADVATPVADGDRVGLFPSVSGG